MQREAISHSDEIKVLQEGVGLRIRILRKRRNLTLEDMSKRTGLSVSLLSQIEKGQVNANISNLCKLSQVLTVEMADFFRQGLKGDFEIIWSDQRKKILPVFENIERDDYSYELVASLNSERTVEVFMVEIAVIDPEKVKYNSHPGIGLTFVLEGKVAFLSKGGRRDTLSAGDSIRFMAEYPHAYRAIGEKTRVLAIIYSPPHCEE